MRSVRPIYPFLLAIYPALALAAQNVYERIQPAEMALPLGASLYLALVAWVLARPVTNTLGQRGLVTAVALVLFFGYGALLRLFRSAIPAVEELLSVWVLIGELAVLAAIVVVMRRQRWRLDGVTRYLNVVCAILLLLALFEVARPRASASEIAFERAAPGRLTGPVDSLRPDVVIVILDSYNSSRALEQYYGFDNSRFESELRSRGLIVPRNARSNYSHTFQALASMLNARYLDHEFAQISPESNDKSLLDPLIESHLVWSTLKPLGYKFVFFPTYFTSTATNRNADIVLPAASETSSEFGLVWLRMTPVIPLARTLCQQLRCSTTVFDLTPEPAARIEWKLEQIPRLVGGTTPSLVFLHVMAPHEPFVFDANCAAREVYWPQAHPASENPAVRAAYIAQVQCLNRKMLELVDAIIAKTSGNAIIILQADHGYGQLGKGPDSYGIPSIDQIDERTRVFGAYHVPDAPPDLFHDSITPVNVFRAVLQQYFALQLPRLEDRAYFSTYYRPYKLQAVHH